MTNPFVQAARSYKGVPFRHMGRSRNAVDCAGLIKPAALDIGRELIDLSYYGREPWQNGLERVLRANFGKMHKTPKVGDVGLFSYSPGSPPAHLAVFGDYRYGNLSLIHCYGEVGRVVEHGYTGPWIEKFVGAFTP